MGTGNVDFSKYWNSPTAPTQVPDLTDESTRKARAASLLTQSLGQSIGSTFLTGSRGITTPKRDTKTLLGA
jgi:hypothetical protein